MGGETNKHNGIIVKQVDGASDGAGDTKTTGAGRKAGASSKGNSSTDTGTSSGAGGSGSSGSGTGAGATTKEKVVPGLSTVKTDEEKRLARNERRRQRYAEKKAEQGGTVKPRKVNSVKKKEEKPALSNDQLNSLILSFSAVIASRPKCEHWLLTEAEVNSITTPLSNMLKESAVFEKIGEHSNQIALIVACVTVFMPRVIKSVAMIQEEKKNEQRVKRATEERNKIKNHKSSGQNGGGNAGASAGNGKDSSVNEYWFGEAIY